MNYLELKTNPTNPRRITDKQFDKLKKSIGSFTKMLEVRPIAYDEDGVIWGGNMRYEALKASGIEMKPEYFKELKDFTLEEKREFAIRDNVELGEWDDDILANEWSDLPLDEWGIDTSGWTKEVEEDEAPEVDETAEPISKLGEVYQLGRHRLMCGDSTKIEDVEKLMNGQKADFIYTDPPYGDLIITNSKGEVGKANVAKVTQYHKYVGEGDFDFRPCWELMKDINCKKVIWGGNYFADYLPITTAWVVWDKRAGEHSWFSDCELAWSSLGTPARVYSITWQGMIREGENDKRVHPTQKPIALASKIIGEHSEGNNVLDLFGGSGSTLIACEQLDRTCYMCELDERYCDVIRKRYAKFIGKEEEWEQITPAI